MLFIEGNRDGYSPKQCGRTMTVGKLREYLDNFDEDCFVYLKNDNGYTYGSITEMNINESYEFDEEEDEYED